MGFLAKATSICVLATVIVGSAGCALLNPSPFKPIDTGRPEAVLNRIAEDPEWIEYRTMYGVSPLLYAAESGRLDACKILLEHGADLNTIDILRRTPLLAAIAAGHTDVAQYLLSKGADVNATTTNGRTPLYEAVRVGDLELVKELIFANAKLNTVHDGQTLFEFAVEQVKRNREILRRIRDGLDLTIPEQVQEKRLETAEAIARRLQLHGASRRKRQTKQ